MNLSSPLTVLYNRESLSIIKNSRPVARIFYGWVRSVDYTDQRAPEALFTRGVRGHAPREILKIKLSETAFRAF